ncbi:MAG: RecX family transcriptional regulator [Clostridia bacterium]|nr:RecX family transcriptional regulator [Clostridia bacterium]
MGEITAILPQKKDKTRCNIYLNGQFYCGMKLEVVMNNRLKCGAEVSPSYLDNLQLESEKMTALDKALNHLSSSMKTRKQITDFLKKKGYLNGIIEYVLEKLESYGYIDDAEYARQYTNSAGKTKGRRLIALELQKKGISVEQAHQAVENIQGEEQSALKILQKYMKNKPSDRETLYKAFRYLIGKGFEYDTVKSALQAFGEIDEDT